MAISHCKQAQQFVDAAVAAGRYASAKAVVEKGLALMAEQEQKPAWLRDKIQRSIESGATLTDEEVAASIEAHLDEVEKSARQERQAAE